MTVAIEDYAMIGDGQTAALVSRHATIDWLCWPRFDSEACLCGLLGSADNGSWAFLPTTVLQRATRQYLDDTLVLSTELTFEEGTVRVIDFMPMESETSSVVRIVEGVHGTVRMGMVLRLRLGYGRIPPWLDMREDAVVACVGPAQIVLRSSIPLQIDEHVVKADLTVKAGDRINFVLSYGAAHLAPPEPLDAITSQDATVDWWRNWIGRFDKPAFWPDAVKRSLITLKALFDKRTGGLVAAPTTSLPEKPGGSLNWDYRYCWLRDATFTVGAMLNAGYTEEAESWRNWILRAVAGAPELMQIMYRVDGGQHVGEREIDWLSGYRWSTPVRVGNIAVHQTQTDVYGELLDALHVASRGGIPPTAHSLHLEREIALQIEQVWRQPGQGLWESRQAPRHYVYSKAMCWVGIDRFLRGDAVRKGMVDAALLARFQSLRTESHDQVCREGFHPVLNSFVQHYGAQDLDASVLLLPLIGFLPIDDPRITGTIAAIEAKLTTDGLVWRQKPKEAEPQGTFLACSFWLADCQRLQGRVDEAKATVERVLALANDVGLLSEEYNVLGRHLSGNFPQALSHLALVTTALSFAGPVIERGGP